MTAALAMFCAAPSGCVERSNGSDVQPSLSLDGGQPVLEDGFTYISSVRELSDGRVLITDPRESRFLVVNPATGDSSTVGSRGFGPAEWSSAVPVYAMGGDSSIQLDSQSRRWLLLDGSRIVDEIPPESPAVLATRGTAWGADDRGHVLAYQPPELEPVVNGRIGPEDSIAAVLVNRTTGATDTAVMLAGAPGVLVVEAGGDGQAVVRAISRPAFATAEQTALFADGWMATVRLRPYRVDWRSPDGATQNGEPAPVAPTPWTPLEEASYLERNANAIADLERAPEPMRSTLMRRFTEFPDAVPPFDGNALLAGGDGRLYVRRSRTVAHPLPRYDVFDRSSGFIGSVQLAEGERLAGVGARYLYVVWKDADDVERLRRHRRP